MKVTRDTDAQLVLEDKPWVLGVGITLAAVMALGFVLFNLVAGDFAGATTAGFILAMCLGAFVAFVRRIIVFMDRATGRITVRVASVFGVRETGVALADVARAEVDTRLAKRSKDHDTHRPILRLKAGDVFVLSEIYSSGRGANSLVAHIKGWLTRVQS